MEIDLLLKFVNLEWIQKSLDKQIKSGVIISVNVLSVGASWGKIFLIDFTNTRWSLPKGRIKLCFDLNSDSGMQLQSPLFLMEVLDSRWRHILWKCIKFSCIVKCDFLYTRTFLEWKSSPIYYLRNIMWLVLNIFYFIFGNVRNLSEIKF